MDCGRYVAQAAMLSERAAWEKEMGSAIARVKAEMGESARGHGAMQAGHTAQLCASVDLSQPKCHYNES